MTRAVIYTRVSTREQAQHGLSLGAQEARCREHCVQQGWGVASVLADPGVSGAVPLFDRPSFAMLNEQLPAVDRLVISRLDRLCRDTKDFLFLIDEFDRDGVGIVALDLGVDLGTPEGRLFHTLVVSFAEYERGVLCRRTQSGMDRARQLGKHCGRPPYGWKLDGGLLVSDRAESRVIADMARLRLGGHSYQGVADFLQRRAGPGKRGGRWTAATVRVILKRECARLS